MRYALMMCALLGMSLRAAETIKLTEKDKEKEQPNVLRSNVTIAPGMEKLVCADPKDFPFYLVLEYLGTVGKVTFAVSDDSIKTIRVDASYITANPKASWRAILDAICRDNKLRVDDSRLEKDRLIVISKPTLISIKLKDADIREVLWSIAQTGKVNIVIDPDVKGNVTVSLTDVPAEEAIATVARTLDYVAVKEKTGEFRVK